MQRDRETLAVSPPGTSAREKSAGRARVGVSVDSSRAQKKKRETKLTRRLVADTELESGRAPVDELDL